MSILIHWFPRVTPGLFPVFAAVFPASELINVDFQIWLFKPIHIKNSSPIISISENDNFILDLNNIDTLNLIYHLKYNKFELL